MSHTPLGEVCLALGLMTPDAVADVLSRLRTSGRARFGEIAMELHYIDDEGLARALAHQFRLNMVPPDRLARLFVAPEVIELLPSGLIRDRLLIPTFLDEEKRVLSLLTTDPTDIPSLRAAQTAARAARLRLFVAPRDAMRLLVDRLLPPEEMDTRPAERSLAAEPPPTRGRTVVFEPDTERAAVLRRLEALEGGGAEVVGDPEQVSAFIEANQIDRVFLRKSLQGEIEPYLLAWKRRHPLVSVCALDGFSAGRRIAVPYDATRDFFMDVIASALRLDADGAWQDTVTLVRAMAEEADLPPEHRDAVALTALFWGLGSTDDDDVHSLEQASELLATRSPPYDVGGVVAALLPRLTGEAGPGSHPGAELLYTARVAVRAELPATDPVGALGSEAARHDGRALSALAAVLHRQELRRRVRAGPPRPPDDEPDEPALQEQTSLFGSLRRALGRASAPAVSGRLSDLSLTDLIQTLTIAGKSARVVVLGGAERGSLQVRDGKLVAASHGVRTGESALHTLVAVREARFEVRFEDDGATNLSGPSESLLLDAVRRRDEARSR